MLAIAADSESDGVDALLVVEARVARAVLAQEAATVTLVARGLLQAAYLGAILVGPVRRIGVIDDGRDAGLAEDRQVGGDLTGGLAVKVRILGREPDVEPGLGQLGNLVASGVRGLDSGQVDGGPPGLFGNDRVPAQDVVQAAQQPDQGVIAKPLVRAGRDRVRQVAGLKGRGEALPRCPAPRWSGWTAHTGEQE